MADPVKDGGITATSQAEAFNGNSRPLTEEETKFMAIYNGNSFNVNNRAQSITNMINNKDRHPAVEAALKDVIENPKKFDLQMEEHNIIMQIFLGIPEKTFRPIHLNTATPG